MGATQSINRPTVLKTPTKGSLKGIEQVSRENGRVVCRRYTSIPYALPPIGNRRWKRPEALPEHTSFDKANGEPGEYNEFGNVCPQPVYGHSSASLPNGKAAPEVPKNYSEDCLYLNIWVPGGEAPKGGWPVQFFIHGGWLQVGDANQSNNHDPYDLLIDYPRIIVAPTYRLNLFGFLACSELSAEGDGYSGNYGFWDQRMALEWTYKNIHLFVGNHDNISVGGLSAGAYSTIFQLHYDVHRPNPADRLIKRVFLFSNAVGVQPKSSNSSECQTQFDELLKAFNIASDMSSAEKLAALRQISDHELANKIHSLKYHTFRAATDDSFISSSFLASISNGSFTDRLYDQNIRILLGEVADECMLYRLVNPPSSYDTLVTQMNNYYPAKVTKAVLEVYELPSSDADAASWCEVGGGIIADCQVHATIRGFASSLLAPPPGHKALPIERVHRYRISWRAKALDEWLDPSVKVCHAADVPIWWESGKRAGFDPSDIQITHAWLDPFAKFLQNEDEEVQWGTRNEREIKHLTKEGKIEVVSDDGWDRGIQVWNTMLQAQLKVPES